MASVFCSSLISCRSNLAADSLRSFCCVPSGVLPSQIFRASAAAKRLRTPRSSTTAAAAGEGADVEVAEGFTMNQFMDKVIDVFMNEKPRSKHWKKYLILRDEWIKYRDRFYSRCKIRADEATDSETKQNLVELSRRVKKIDDEMDKHFDLLKEIQDSPRDVNAIVAKRRQDFTESFFQHLNLLSETHDNLEDRDAVARLGARCLSAVSSFDNTLEIMGTLDTAQEKFDDILNSPSLDAACDKIKSLAKVNQLDSSLILLINGAWASAKQSIDMKNEVKEIMHRIYKTTQSSLRSMEPKEIKLLKYLLNIADPEERFSALATSFSPGDEYEVKQQIEAIYTTPKELHKWVKIMLDAYHLNKEETEMREAKKMSQPVVMQRLFILKQTIEEEYLERNAETGEEDKQGGGGDES
ncbi:hypothetical protein M569_10004 [Genlisea aurea]|uniref:Uncharacterized protein n=1 Tax=Genlisea aurea TaxID=192259 RepID=S8CD03_9LAMI|nr:hypothetical protein M569_10004 [Genlisea aurea]